MPHGSDCAWYRRIYSMYVIYLNGVIFSLLFLIENKNDIFLPLLLFCCFCCCACVGYEEHECFMFSWGVEAVLSASSNITGINYTKFGLYVWEPGLRNIRHILVGVIVVDHLNIRWFIQTCLRYENPRNLSLALNSFNACKIHWLTEIIRWDPVIEVSLFHKTSSWRKASEWMANNARSS